MFVCVVFCCCLYSNEWVISEETSCSDAMEPVGMTNRTFKSIPHSLVPHFPNWSHMISHNDPELPEHTISSNQTFIRMTFTWKSEIRLWNGYRENIENLNMNLQRYFFDWPIITKQPLLGSWPDPDHPCWVYFGIMTGWLYVIPYITTQWFKKNKKTFPFVWRPLRTATLAMESRHKSYKP